MDHKYKVSDRNTVARVVGRHRQWCDAYVEVKRIVREMSEKGITDLEVDAMPIHAHLNRIAGFNSFFANTQNEWWLRFRPFEAYPQDNGKTLIKYRDSHPCNIWRKVEKMEFDREDLERRISRIEQILQGQPETIAYDRKVFRIRRTQELSQTGMSNRKARKIAWEEAGREFPGGDHV